VDLAILPPKAQHIGQVTACNAPRYLHATESTSSRTR
jgi:hypothetical protein